MVTCPLQRHLPLTVNSPPRQPSALFRTQVPPATAPDAGEMRKPEGQVQAPLTTVPPSQTTDSSGLRVMVSEGGDELNAGAGTYGGAGGAGATAVGGGAAGAGSAAGCSGKGGGLVGDSLVTHLPFQKSCQGKQPLSDARFLCGPECAGQTTEKLKPTKIAAVTKMRVMQKACRHPIAGYKTSFRGTAPASQPKASAYITFDRSKRPLFDTPPAGRPVCLICAQRIRRRPESSRIRRIKRVFAGCGFSAPMTTAFTRRG